MYLRRLLVLPLLAACLCAAAAFSPVRAEEKKAEKPAAPDTKAIDTQIFTTLKDIINQGADLYNPPANDFAGCYRLYEGALKSMKLVLVHRPNLQKAIDDGLTKARTAPLPDKAFVLRDVIDQIRRETNPNPPKTLWDRLGGEAGVTKVIDDFVGRAATDPKVDFFRGGKYKPTREEVANLKKKLVELVSAVSGGPLKYTGKSMKEVHMGMGITDAQFDAIAGDLALSLRNAGVAPEDAKAVLEAVGSTRKDIVEPKKVETPPVKTLWDRLGGEAGVSKVVEDFVAAAAPDPKVNFFRDGKYKPDAKGVADLKKKLVELISSVSGGPLKYTGKSMKEVHKGMGITDAEFDALAGHLKTALEKNKVAPDDVTLVMTVIGGTRRDIVEKKGAEAEPTTKLWDRLGGEAGVKVVVADFVAAAAADPKVNFDRNGKYKLDAKAVEDLKTKLVELVSAVSGGPLKYTGKNMTEVHKGMGITDAEFDALAGHLKAVLEKHKVAPADVNAVLTAVGKTRSEIVEKKVEPEPMAKTLWDRLGGEKGVGKVVDEFVKAGASDPKVDFFRDPDFKPTPEKVADLKKKLVELISTVSGGPLKYTGKSMKEAHKGMKITDAEFDALAKHLETALKSNGVVPDDVKAVMDAVGTTRKDIVEK